MSTSTATRLHSLAIHLLRHARAADAGTGLTAARLSLLSVLVFGGSRTVTELARAEQVATPTMTRLLQGLERDGYVRRRRHAEDARVVRVTATAAGRRVLEAGRAARVERIESVLRHLAPADAAALEHAVAAVEHALVAAQASA